MLLCVLNLCLLWPHDYHHLLQTLGDGACGNKSITEKRNKRKIVRHRKDDSLNYELKPGNERTSY